MQYDRPTRPPVYVAPPGGTWALYEVVQELLDIEGLGVYNPRTVAGSTALSEHATTQACDWLVDARRPEGLIKGDLLAGALVSVAGALGIQSVIWNRRVWGYGTDSWRPYGGVSPHIDHVHAGVTRFARDHLTEAQVRSALAPLLTPPSDPEVEMPAPTLILSDINPAWAWEATPGEPLVAVGGAPLGFVLPGDVVKSATTTAVLLGPEGDSADRRLYHLASYAG